MLLKNNSNELFHYGVLGMKWGVKKKRDEYGNRKDGSIIFAPQKAMIKTMLKDMSNSPNDMLDKGAINYNTKNMNDKQKKLYTLNYYNDRKAVSEMQNRDTRAKLEKINSSNKTRNEQLYIDLMGSNFLNEVANMNLKSAKTARDHYSKKVDEILNEIGDVKLKTIKEYKTVNYGNTTYSWYGDTYVEE